MCLSTVVKNDPAPSTLIVDGWKEFIGTPSCPFFPAFIHKGTRVVPLDVWITADPTQTPNGKTIKADDGTDYAAGMVRKRSSSRSRREDGISARYME